MKSKKIKENFLIGLIIFILVGISFYDVIFFGKTFKVTTANSQALPSGAYGQEQNKPKFIPVNGTDSPVQEEPIYEFIKQSLKKGILPLWNPHQGCGFPLIAMIETGMFFPVSWIMYLFPQRVAWDIMILIRFFLAGLFTYWMMRALKFKPIPSLGAAIIYMLSGPMVVLQYWLANVNILTPLLILTLEYLLKKTSLRNVALVALAVAATFYGGHPENTFFVNLFGFLFFIYRLLTIRPKPPLQKSLFFLGIAYVLGLGLSAMILFPFLRNMATEFWHAHPENIGLTTGEFQNRMITVVIPHFFQCETLKFDFTFAGWWGGYIGILPFALAFLGLLKSQKQKLNYFLGILGFIIIAKCYAVPIINWIGYLPIIRITRFYVHTTFIFALIMAILAGMGIRYLMLRPKLFKKGLYFSLGLGLILLAHLIYVRSADHFSISLRATFFSLGVLTLFQIILYLKDHRLVTRKIIGAIIISAIFLELFLYIHRERVNRFDSFPEVPYIEFLKNHSERIRSYGIFWAFYPNTASGFQVDDFGIFFGLVPKRFVAFINNLVVKDLFQNNLRPPAVRALPITLFSEPQPYLNLLNVVYTIANKNLERILPAAQSPDFPKPIYDDEVKIFKRPDAFPRIFIVHRAVFEEKDDLIFEEIRRMKDHLNEVVILQHKIMPEIMRELGRVPLHDDSQAEIIKYEPNEVVITAKLQNPGFLVLSDSYHPDWKVYVDGKESQIFITDYLIRSVFLDEGVHQVKFVFHPKSFYGGASLSLLCLIVVGIFAVKRRP